MKEMYLSNYEQTRKSAYDLGWYHYTGLTLT